MLNVIEGGVPSPPSITKYKEKIMSDGKREKYVLELLPKMKNKIKIYLFADYMGFKSDEENFRDMVAFTGQNINREFGLDIEFDFKAKNNFNDIETLSFDIALIDYGALSVNSFSSILLDKYNADLIEIAEEKPSAYFYIVSEFTQYAVDDFMENNKDIPANIIPFTEKGINTDNCVNVRNILIHYLRNSGQICGNISKF